MTLDLGGVASFLLENDNYLILTHAHPDGDTLGSGYGLCRLLRSIGKKANVTNDDVIHRKFAFIVEEDQPFDSAPQSPCDSSPCTGEPETIVSVDVADTILLGSVSEEKYADKIDLCIDHHYSNRVKAKYSYIDGTAAACTEIIYLLAEKLGAEIDPQTANCLFTGLTTDTGCFRYGNVTYRTHIIAAELIRLGANAADINNNMFEVKTKTYAALEKLALDSMKFYYGGKAAVIVLTQEMFARSGSDESECDAICSLPRQVEGVLVGITLREKKDGSYKASVRTYGELSAADICARLGGGGHKNAAGCQLTGTKEEATEKILEAAGRSL